jgi:hypothetical protein
MIKHFLKDELTQYIGSDIEVSTNTFEVVEGLLENVSNNLVAVVELLGFGLKKYRYISLNTINYVRIL